MTTLASQAGSFEIGGDLTVNRLGYGAMQLTGDGSGDRPKIATRRSAYCSGPSRRA